MSTIPWYYWGVTGGLGERLSRALLLCIGLLVGFAGLPNGRARKAGLAGGRLREHRAGGRARYGASWNGEIRCHTDFGLFMLVLYLAGPWRRWLTDRA